MNGVLFLVQPEGGWPLCFTTKKAALDFVFGDRRSFSFHHPDCPEYGVEVVTRASVERHLADKEYLRQAVVGSSTITAVELIKRNQSTHRDPLSVSGVGPHYGMDMIQEQEVVA